MAELITEIISQEAFNQVKQMDANLEKLVKQFENSARASMLINQALTGSTGYKGATDAIKEQAAATSALEKEIQKLKIAQSEEGKEIQRVRTETALLNSETRKAEKDAIQSANAYKMLSLQHREATETAKKLGAQFGVTSKEFQTAAALANKYDQQLKAIDSGLGNYKRNVGNYTGAVMSLSQVFRELPAFAYSAGTGILGISNNLPILADNFKAVAAATNEATGKINGTMGALKIFARSIFSLGNIFTIALGIFTIFAARMSQVDKEAKKTKETFSDLADASDTLAMALKSSDYTDAVRNINTLKISVDLAKQGFIDKEDVVNQYNKTLGQTMGTVKSLDGVEQAITANGEAYIQMTLLKAAANLALQKSAEEAFKVALEQERKQKQSLREFDDAPSTDRSTWQTFKDFLSGQTPFEAQMGEIDKSIQGSTDSMKEFNKIASDFMTEAAKIAKAAKFDFDGGKYDTKTTKTKAGAKAEADKAGDGYLASIAERLKKEIALRKKSYDEYLALIKENLDAQQVMFDKADKAKIDADNMYTEVVMSNMDAQQQLFDKYDKEQQDAFQAKIDSLQATASIINSLTSVLNDISSLQFDIEMERINKKDKALDESYKSDLRRLESSGKSKEQIEKDRQLLEAQTEAQRKLIDKERAAAARKKAQSDRASDIANIITGTALAVVNALGSKPYTPLNIALAAAAGATGAAQLARAIATPLPSYEKGTQNHPGGYAQVSEAGQELVIQPDGTKYLTPKRKSIIHLPKGSKVIPNNELIKSAQNAAMIKLAGMGNSVTTDSYGEALIDSFENKIEKLIKVTERKNTNVSVNLYGGFENYVKSNMM